MFNGNANNLSSIIYGVDQEQNKEIFATDPTGRMILSPQLSVDIAADNLDIKDLTSLRDSLTILASQLDIRNLSGTADTVENYNNAFAEDADSGTIAALGTRIFLAKNISNYRRNYYVVRNTGGVAVTVTLQIAPADIENYYVNSGSQFNLLAGSTSVFTPNSLSKYARVRVSAVLLGSVTVNYFGQA